MTQQLSEITNRLNYFVKGYVRIFELYFSELCKLVAEGASQDDKVARLTADISGFVKTGETQLNALSRAEAVIAADVISQIVHFACASHDQKVVKKLASKLSNAAEDPLSGERHLFEAAGQIFSRFESQLMSISSDVSVDSALQRLALDAALRAISHLRENPDSDIDSFTLCKGLIKGKSKKCAQYSFWRNGHSIKIGDNVYSPDIFKKFGVRHNGTYYVHKEMKHSRESLGFRLSFEREPISSQNYTALSEAPSVEYEYLLDQERLKEVLTDISTDGALELCDDDLDEIRKAAAEQAQNILTSMGKNQSAVDTLFNEIKEKIKRSSEKVKPICNVPQPVGWFAGRTDELARLDDMINRRPIESPTLNSLITVITDLGGIGKTELARKYAYQHRGSRPDSGGRWKFFDVVWLNGEDSVTLGDSFRDFAQHYCGLPIKDAVGDNRCTSEVVEDVYAFLISRHCNEDKLTLMIFDNIRDGNPGEFFPGWKPASSKFRLLITSRHTEWNIGGKEVSILVLDALQPKEAVELVKTRLQEEDERVMELCKELQYFPLSLHLATEFILNAREDAAFSVQEFLKAFAGQLKELGDNSEFGTMSGGKHFTKTTLATYNVIVDRLKENQFGSSAVRILSIVGYTATHDIRMEMFSLLKEMEKELAKESVRLLVKYSLVEWDERKELPKKSFVRVQRLLQEMIRLRLEKRGEVEKALNETMQLLMSGSDLVNDCHCDGYFEQLSWLVFSDLGLQKHVFRLLNHIENADQSGFYSTRIVRLKEAFFRKAAGDEADPIIATLLFSTAATLFSKFSHNRNLRGIIICKSYVLECLDIYNKFISDEVPYLLLKKLRLYNGLWEIGILEEHLSGSGREEAESVVKQHIPDILAKFESCSADSKSEFMKKYITHWVLGKAYMIVGEKEKAVKCFMDWLTAAEELFKDNLRPYVDALLAYFRYNSEGQLGADMVFVMRKLKGIFGDSLGQQTYYADEPYEFEPFCAIDGAIFSPPPPPEPPAPTQADVVVERSLLSRLFQLKFRINF